MRFKARSTRWTNSVADRARAAASVPVACASGFAAAGCGSAAFGWRGLRPRAQASRQTSQSGFTLAEVLAALLFMAIVIPVAVGGLRVASLAGEVAARKSEAVRVAERVLNESIVTTNWNKSLQNGTVVEGNRQFAWTLRTDTWSQDGTQYAPRLLSVEVAYSAQDRDFVVRLHTLAPSLQPQ